MQVDPDGEVSGGAFHAADLLAKDEDMWWEWFRAVRQKGEMLV